MDMIIVNQKIQLNEDAKHGHGHDAAGHDAAGHDAKDASHGAHEGEAKPAEGHH